MSARFGLVGKKSSWPHLGPFQAMLSMGRKNAKIEYVLPIFLGGPMAAIQPVWANGMRVIHLQPSKCLFQVVMTGTLSSLHV